jgi:hypothetical protein
LANIVAMHQAVSPFAKHWIKHRSKFLASDPWLTIGFGKDTITGGWSES